MKLSRVRVVYEPDKFVKAGFFASSREMVFSLLRSKELIWRLFLREFKAKYRQSLLGIVWAVLNPIITVGIFLFLNSSGILNIGRTPVPYPAFALIGVSVYGIFSTGLSACANSIVGSGPMVVKINFPKISLVLAALGQSLVEFMVRLIFIIVLLIVYGIVPSWTFIFLPLAILPILFLTLGIGLFLALLAGVFRDVIHLVSFFTTLLLFMVPALYPAPQAGILAVLNEWNPLSHLIIGCRDMLILGFLSNPSGFLWSSASSTLILLISWKLFFVSEPRIAERV